MPIEILHDLGAPKVTPHSTPSDPTPSSRTTFFSLPLELRFQIYGYLIDPEPVSYPYGWTPIRARSHRPPPQHTLLLCKALSDELRAYYYNTTVLCFLIPVPRVQVPMHSDRSLLALRHARKIELYLNFHERASDAKVLREKAKEALGRVMMDVRVHGALVHTIFVSVSLFRAEALPFGKEELRPPHDVEFAVGEINTDTPEIEESFRQALRGMFKELGTQEPLSRTAFPY